MRISDVIGLLAALIGSTATLLAAWAYIRSQHPPKGELLRAGFAVTVIMATILGIAVFISRATIQVNGQDTIPVPPLPAPGFVAPGETTPAPATTSTPTLSPSPSSTPTPSPSPSSTPTLSPSSTPTLSPSSMLTPSPKPKPKKR